MLPGRLWPVHVSEQARKKPMPTNPCGRYLLLVLGVFTVGSAPAQLPERQLQHSRAAGGLAEALANLPVSGSQAT